jgi:hypothetical protein
VTALLAIQGVVCFLVLALLIYLMTRAPRNVPLRMVTVMIACWGVGYVIGLYANNGDHLLGLGPLGLRLIQHLLEATAAYCLVTFYVFSALDTEAARRKAFEQAMPLAVAAVIMTIATVTIPPEVRVAAAELPAGRVGGPVSVTGVAVLYLTVNLYQLYALFTSLVWTRHYARGAEPRLRRGLGLASIGLAAIVVALASFAAANVVRWAGGVFPHLLMTAGITLILSGIVVFLAGVAYPAALMRLAALRIWLQHRRIYTRLGPLWTVLHEEFPEDALHRVPAGGWRDRLGLRGVHRRYYRRVIECRDGLVRISPYLAASAQSGSLAERLRDGLHAHAAGLPAPTRAIAVAIPDTDGLDADVHELVELSQALQATTARQVRAAAPA